MTDPHLTAAAWRGDELFRRDDWLYELTPTDIAELREATVRLQEPGRSIEGLQRGDFSLGPFAEVLSRVQSNLEHGSGACLIQRLPVDQFTAEETQRLFWGVAVHLGTPVSQSARGQKIFSVRDEGFQVGHPQARGPNTRKRLSFHTDRCDVIAFLCLKQAKSGGENQVVSSVTLYNEMLRRRPDLVQVLRQPFYYRRHNVDTGNEKPWCRQPIFSFYEGHFAASYLRVLIDRAHQIPELPTMTDQQREALDFLEELAADPALHVSFRLEPGDMLFLNNWVTFHRRNEFEDFAEPERRRHLLRVWLAVPNSRPLHPDFAANFGATAAGAIRGGMRPLTPELS